MTITRTQQQNARRKLVVEEPHGFRRYPRHCRKCYNAWQREQYAKKPKSLDRRTRLAKLEKKSGFPPTDCCCPGCDHRALSNAGTPRRQVPSDCVDCECCEFRYHTYVKCPSCSQTQRPDGSCGCYKCPKCRGSIPPSKMPHAHCPECEVLLDPDGVCPWKREEPETHPGSLKTMMVMKTINNSIMKIMK